ncbi:MAG: hypothetical protein ACW98K_07265 [Candidatus Kariarchaeaceae archaeon]|jgi:hypothetical protein
MIGYKSIQSLLHKGTILILISILVHISLSDAIDSDIKNVNQPLDQSIELNAVDSGFQIPGATLYNNWINYTNNPLGWADRNTADYNGFQPTSSSTTSSSTTTYTSTVSGCCLGLSSLLLNAPLEPNSLTGINYNFNFLPGTIIEGIEVRILHATWNGNTGYYANISVELQWNGRSLNTTSEKFDYVNDQYRGSSNNFKNVTLGSPTDLWGRPSWSAVDFSDQNFGVKIVTTDLFPNSMETVDVAWVKVYYSDAPIVINDPWIQIENIPPSIDFTLGKILVVNLNSTIIDPSSLGYSPFNVTILVNDSVVLTLTTWNNDTLLPINATPYLVTESVYNVTVSFSATNGTDWIFKEVSFLVNVLTDTDQSTSSSSTANEFTGSTSDGSPSISFNLYFGLVFFIGMGMIRRKK